MTKNHRFVVSGFVKKCVMNSLKDCESFDAETLGIFGPPICAAVVNNSVIKERIKSFLLKGKCGPNRYNHGWKQIRTGEPAQPQAFTLKMFEKVWSRFNQGIM